MKKFHKKPNMANALILNKDNYCLLVHNIKNGQNKWRFPGGKLKREDKNLKTCVIREIEKEIGCKIKIRKKVLEDYKTTTPEGNFLCRTYSAEIIEGEPEIMKKEKTDKLRYFSYNNLLNLNENKVLAPNLVLALPKLREYMD